MPKRGKQKEPQPQQWKDTTEVYIATKHRRWKAKVAGRINRTARKGGKHEHALLHCDEK